ncbi:MAG: DUF481 domain-containing protein [Phycisphaerales bacterium]|nr:MAG: DUF481 domain-containing protein [Phycisphaerales bacterium]
MTRSVLLMCLTLAAFACPADADELLFKNGDRLTGKIVQLVDGKLIFDSVLAGKVTVDINDVQTFSSDVPIQIHLADGTVINQKVSATTERRFAIETGPALKAQEFETGSVLSINPPEKPRPKWTGNLSGAFTSTHGNTQTDSVSASANLSRRTEKDRTTLGADYARGRQVDPDTGDKKTTEDWWRTRGKYDYFFTKRLYGYLDGRYEKDSIADLDRRVIIGGGGGYQWVESDDMNFSTEAGLASVYEKYDDQSDGDSRLSAQLGYHFDKKLVKIVKFIHELTYYPSTEKISDYYLTSTAELRTNLTENMFTNFKVIFDYDATPAQGSGSTDIKYLLGVGWSF